MRTYNLPYSIRTIKRGGKYRKTVIQYQYTPNGSIMDCGYIICQSVEGSYVRG